MEGILDPIGALFGWCLAFQDRAVLRAFYAVLGSDSIADEHGILIQSGSERLRGRICGISWGAWHGMRGENNLIQCLLNRG